MLANPRPDKGVQNKVVCCFVFKFVKYLSSSKPNSNSWMRRAAGRWQQLHMHRMETTSARRRRWPRRYLESGF